MKIAYLLGSLDRGGTETLLLDVVNAIKRNSKIESILIHRLKGNLYQDFQKTGIDMYELSPRKNKLSYFLKLRCILQNKKIEIVHAHQPLDAFYAYIACIGTTIKISLTFHGYDYNNKWISKLITHFIIHLTHINIYVSNHVKKYYVDKFQLKNRNVTLYNGIDEKKNKVNLDNYLKEEFILNDNTLLMGTVGNFVSVRDPLTICRFLNLLNQKGIMFHFIFVGAKNQKELRLFNDCFQYCQENRLTNNVKFIGSRDDVPAILKQLDAFLYSTNHDTFGIAVVEAMMAGIPVFVNDWEVMNEITENGSYANIYQTKNEFDLLIKFNDFLANQSLYKQKAIENSIIIKEKYSIQSHLLGLQIIYKDLNKNNA